MAPLVVSTHLTGLVMAAGIDMPSAAMTNDAVGTAAGSTVTMPSSGPSAPPVMPMMLALSCGTVPVQGPTVETPGITDGTMTAVALSNRFTDGMGRLQFDVVLKGAPTK